MSDPTVSPTPPTGDPAAFRAGDAGRASDLAKPARRHVNPGRNLPAAITTGVVLMAIVVFTLWLWHFGFVLFVALVLCLSTVEIARAVRHLDMEVSTVPIAVGTVLIVIGSYISRSMPNPPLTSQTLQLVLLGATVMAALIWRMPKGPSHFVRDASASLLVIGYLPLLGSFISLLMAGANGPMRIITTLLGIVGSDTGGYLAGVLFGKHPMAPVISPKKTWEGLAGSVILATAAEILCSIYLLHTGWWVGLILGLVVVVFGTCGDLIESLIKRDVGIKDMSHFLPGHGGVMDRIDSILIAAPAAWLVLFLCVPGG